MSCVATWLPRLVPEYAQRPRHLIEDPDGQPPQPCLAPQVDRLPLRCRKVTEQVAKPGNAFATLGSRRWSHPWIALLRDHLRGSGRACLGRCNVEKRMKRPGRGEPQPGHRNRCQLRNEPLTRLKSRRRSRRCRRTSGSGRSRCNRRRSRTAPGRSRGACTARSRTGSPGSRPAGRPARLPHGRSPG